MNVHRKTMATHMVAKHMGDTKEVRGTTLNLMKAKCESYPNSQKKPHAPS